MNDLGIDWQALDPSILGPAFCAGLLVLATHVPLGREVLKRGIIFIDLAIAQIAGLGMLTAQIHDWRLGGWGVQLTAAGSALLGALLLGWLDSHWPKVQEALIGIIFVLAATASLLLIAHNPHGGEHIKELLSGQILWVGWSQLIPVAALYALLLALWFGLPRLRGGAGFYLIFALAITASVQLVGVYLVFTSLIVPALAATGRVQWRALGLAWLIGAVGYALGLLASALADLPSGPAIVWSIAVSALLIGYLLRSKPLDRADAVDPARVRPETGS